MRLQLHQKYRDNFLLSSTLLRNTWPSCLGHLDLRIYIYIYISTLHSGLTQVCNLSVPSQGHVELESGTYPRHPRLMRGLPCSVAPSEESETEAVTLPYIMASVFGSPLYGLRS